MSLNTIWFRRARARFQKTNACVETKKIHAHWIVTRYYCDQRHYETHGMAMCTVADQGVRPVEWLAGTSSASCPECQAEYQRIFGVGNV
jgi:hypothetical protein